MEQPATAVQRVVFTSVDHPRCRIVPGFEQPARCVGVFPRNPLQQLGKILAVERNATDQFPPTLRFEATDQQLQVGVLRLPLG